MLNPPAQSQFQQIISPPVTVGPLQQGVEVFGPPMSAQQLLEADRASDKDLIEKFGWV